MALLSRTPHEYVSARPGQAARGSPGLAIRSFFFPEPASFCTCDNCLFFLPRRDSQLKSTKTNAVDQRELSLVRTPDRTDVPLDIVTRQPSLSKAIALCIQFSGLLDKEILLALDIDAGHWSRIVKGDANFPTNRLGDLMDICGNDAPLMWLAHARGYGLVVLRTESERRAEEAERRLAEEREKVRWLTDLLQGKATA